MSMQTNVRSAPILPPGTRLGPVQLAVTDRAGALAIWRDVVGLDVLAEAGGVLTLGAGGVPLVVLETGAVRPVVARTIGLYHVAIHLPRRADLAAFAVRALERRVRIAPTDHLVSEAIYLSDHDGNGIEMTFETPGRGTLGDPDRGQSYAVTAAGHAHSGREPIDLEGLLAELEPGAETAARLPAGARIGHVHVHVRDLAEAMGFYRDVLGFGGLLLIASFGMGDVGLGYMPHAVAFNVWAGAGAGLSPAGSAGLRWFSVVVPDSGALEAVRGRLLAAGAPVQAFADGIATEDPCGNEVRVMVG